MTAALWRDWRADLAAGSASDWLTVAAYLIAAALAYRAARAAASLRRERAFWGCVTALMVFLGANELLDLQTLLTTLGRGMAVRQGWYEDRRLYQAEFVAALASLAVAVGLAAIWFTRGADLALRWALAGLALIGSFVLLRAATFHHVGGLFDPAAATIGALHELSGIVVVGLAARAYARSVRR